MHRVGFDGLLLPQVYVEYKQMVKHILRRNFLHTLLED